MIKSLIASNFFKTKLAHHFSSCFFGVDLANMHWQKLTLLTISMAVATIGAPQSQQQISTAQQVSIMRSI